MPTENMPWATGVHHDLAPTNLRHYRFLMPWSLMNINSNVNVV